jgi:hypothetical protein
MVEYSASVTRRRAPTFAPAGLPLPEIAGDWRHPGAARHARRVRAQAHRTFNAVLRDASVRAELKALCPTR